jgi:hypothetical protein
MAVKETEMCPYRIYLKKGRFRCRLSGATGPARKICEPDQRNSNDCAEKGVSAEVYGGSKRLSDAIRRVTGHRRFGR